MPRVPVKVLVGPTTYVHFRHKHKDYYAPDFLFNGDGDTVAPPSPHDCAHVWRYTISSAHNNTVFFFNSTTRQSVWVLPIVHRDGTTEALADGAAMHAIDASDSDAEEDSAPAAAAPVAATAASAAVPQLDEDVSVAASAPLQADAVVDNAQRPSATSEVPRALTDMQERVQAAVQRAREAEAGAAAAQRSATNGGSAAGAATLQDRLAAWRARRPVPGVLVSAAPPPAETVAAAASVSTASPPLVVVSDPCAPALSLAAAAGPEAGGTSTRAAGGAATARCIEPQQQQQHHPTLESQPPMLTPARADVTAATSSSAVQAEQSGATVQEAELAAAAAVLHREKLAAMQQVRTSLECRRRALAVEQEEAEERVRLAHARAAAEKARVAAAERAAAAQLQRAADTEAAAAAEARLQEVNSYAHMKEQLETAAQAAVADSFVYATRIAAQLAAAAPRPEQVRLPATEHTPPAAGAQQDDVAATTPAPPHYREHQVGRVVPAVAGPPPAVSPGGTAVPSRQHTSAGRRAAPRLCQSVSYAAPHLYEGEVVIPYRPSSGLLRSAESPSPPTVLTARREGLGTHYYDADRRHYFSGAWRDDVREGPGVLSLPDTAVQGHWHADQLAGPAVVQTRHSKGTVAFASAGSPRGFEKPPTTAAATPSGTSAGATTTLTGNAVVELDSGALFVGALQEGRVRAPYILQLRPGDYIEWLGAPARRRRGGGGGIGGGASAAAAAAAAAAAGTGESRIRFHNGDTYVGHVVDFRLHGVGYYRFAVDGHSYTGRFCDGVPHGEGLLICANGDVYRGGFAAGLFSGRGTYTSTAGQYVYEGDWLAGEMHGEGSLAFANGDVWRGTFRHNRRVAGAYTAVA
ncbi:MORN repeat [Novymonas esmeraldas]|uniref:MORN repeat n=1 Tax=Novymonas esmeraldas TaxID=1808958 RepID=A0AAW0FA22_9TRYP